MALGNIDKLIPAKTKKKKDRSTIAYVKEKKMKTYYLEKDVIEALRVRAFKDRTNVSQLVNQALKEKYL